MTITSREEGKARQELYNEVEQAYLSNNYTVLVEAATGSGKSKIALDLVGDPLNEKWTILVPRLPLFKTWEEEMLKWKRVKLLENVEFLCYASTHKLLPGNNNIILDEAHRLTDRSLPFIKAFKGNGKLIALSATVPFEKKLLLQDIGIHKSNTVKYTLDDAVANDLVTDYNIKVVQFPLDSVTKNIQAGKKGAYFFTTEYDGYRFKEQRVRQMTYTQKEDSIKWAVLDRMRFIYNLPTKLALTGLLLNLLPADKKVIIFCGSIAHANAVCKHKYHSKTDDKDYKDFCNGKITRLAVVQSVAEGVNIPELDYAILMQVQSGQLHAIQKIGRLLRKTSDPTKQGKVILLEALNTQDSKWVASAVSAFDRNKVDYVSYSQVLSKGITI